MLKSLSVSLALSAGLLAGTATGGPAPAPHNVIIFVADGLRSHIVTSETAPALAAVRRDGVNFENSHSVYPTFTTPNAAAIATGHRPGDTGDFGNVIYVGQPFAPPYASVIGGIEDDAMLDRLNARYSGDVLNETSLLRAASLAGFSTATVGKLGPAGLQDVSARDGKSTILIDDATGYPADGGAPVPQDVLDAMVAQGLDAKAPDRGLNTYPGAYNMPGVRVANTEQQAWFRDVTTKVLLPRFKAAGKPFVLVYWSRDPDGTQHNQGDSLNTLTPGINGPTSMAAIRNASDNLQALRDALKALGLDQTTDILVTADHGFSTISRQSETSAAAKGVYRDVQPGFLPGGFLAMDLAKALGLKLFDPSGYEIEISDAVYPRQGSAVIGPDFAHPVAVVAGNGGSDILYLPGADPAAAARRIVEALTREDYTGALFVRDDLGPIPGALPTSRIGMSGTARTPAPAIYVSFRSFSTGCADPETCGAEVADTTLQQGQGMHGSFGRQDTHNFMAAIGPDFRAGLTDEAPVGNADVAPTAAQILGLTIGGAGRESGRLLTEALAADGRPVAHESHVERSAPAANGFVTVLNWQEADGRAYLDAAGAPGRTLGLKP